MKSEKVSESLTLPCCGCDGTATFTPEGEHPTFFHSMPFCERFNSTNTADQLSIYMRECGDKALATVAPSTDWVLPRDPNAELIADSMVRRLWGDGSHIEYVVSRKTVTAAARSSPLHGSALEISVRGKTSADATHRIVRLLGIFTEEGWR